LTAGTSYTVALKALSGTAWTSSSSTTSASVTTNKIGSKPTFTFNSTTANQVDVSYVQTTTGTTPVLYYYYLNGVKSSSLSSTTFSIPSLTNTTANYYSLYILANNAGGDISSNSQYISFVGSVPTGTATPVLNGLSITYSQTTPGTSPTTFYYSYYQDGSNRKGPVTSPFTTDSSSNQNVYVVADNSGGVVVSSAITGAPYLQGSAPSINTITPGLNSLTFAYSASIGGNPPTVSYYYSSDGTTLLGTGTTGTSITVSDLNINQTYQYYIIAVGLSGTTEIWRNVSTISTATRPYIKGTSPTVTVSPVYNSENSLQVTYGDSSGGNPEVTKYQYYTTPPGISGLVDVGGAVNNQFTIPGLTANTSYTVTMRALGSTEWTSDDTTSASVTTNKIGSAPSITNVSAVDGTSNSIRVTFTDPSDGTPSTTKYQYYTTPPGSSGITDAVVSNGAFTITDLSSGTAYTVTMRSVSSTSWVSAYSTTSTSVSTNTLGGPLTVSTLNGEGKITVTYSQVNPGTSTTNFFYSLNGQALISAPASPFDLSGSALTSTSPYSIYVLARNPAGDISSNAFTGYVFGSKPTMSVLNGEGKITVTYAQEIAGTTGTSFFYSLNGQSLTSAPASPFDLSGSALISTSPYSIYVLARNPAGDISSNTTNGNVFGSRPSIDGITKNVGNSITVAFTQSQKGTNTTTYYYSLDGSNVLVDASSSGTSLTIPNLNELTTYSIYVVASNPAGNVFSLASTGVSILGTQPTIDSITKNVGNSITVAFTQSQKGTNTTTYYYSLDGSNVLVDASSSGTPLTIPNLINTSLYSIYVVASNPAGNVFSTVSSNVSIKGTKPTMTLLPVANSSGVLRLTYSQSNTGTAPVSYYYSNNVTGFPRTLITSNPYNITELSGTTSVYIIANNAAGDAISDVSSATPYLLGNPPSISSITPGINTLTVTFSSATGGNPSSFTYYYSYDGINRQPGQVTSPFTISGLTSAKTVYIIANNAAGDAISDVSSATPYLLGNPPSISSITPGINTLTVTFSSATGGNPSSFTYYYSYDGINRQPGQVTSPFTISGLTSQKTVYIIANNTAGDVSSNSFTATPYLLGNPPSISSITPGINTLTVTFSSATGGNPSSFTYYYSYDGINRQPGQVTSPFTISGLTSQKTVYIIANNTAGDVSSNSFTATPYLLVNNPVVNDITPGPNKLTVSFTGSTGANPAPTYYYSLNGGSLTEVPSNQSPFDISGLTQAVSNSVYVLARNIVGDISSNVLTGTPYIIGGAPTITNITAVRSGLSVEFTGSTGGYPSPTTYYYAIDSDSPVNASSTTSPIVIRKLTTVKEYTVRLYAQNSAGLSSASNALTGTPLAGTDTEVITPATYWTLQYWSTPSFWKKSYWSKKRK
jgi:hypothetical protein